MEEETQREEVKEVKEVKTTFLKNKLGTDEFDPIRAEDANKAQPFIDRERQVVFVNGSKHKRAVVIQELLTNKRVPTKAGEAERIEHYRRILNKYDVAPDSADAVPAIYEVLGGLIRTIPEHEEFLRNVEDKSKKAKMIE